MYVELLDTASVDALERKHAGDAGIDLRAEMDGNATFPYELDPHRPRRISTGVKVAIPEGYVGEICSRSGLAARGIIVANAPGIIDSGFRGELEVILLNVTDERRSVSPGERIAQLLIKPYVAPTLEYVDELPESSDGRGEGGFGSTGVK